MSKEFDEWVKVIRLQKLKEEVVALHRSIEAGVGNNAYQRANKISFNAAMDAAALLDKATPQFRYSLT